MVNDPIGDFIIRIKNAGAVHKESISMPFSKMKLAIAEMLSAKGYIGDVTKRNKGNAKYLNIALLYVKDGSPVISGVRRMSKPSRRLYEGAKNIRRFRRGFGLSIFSTPKGIMADIDARKNNVGGEFLFNIW
jgi:small subunit ribosomal protein S8